jgi:putative transposase
MGRRPKNIHEPCCYHITHRCQERRFLFKFEIDRLNYINRLREMSIKFKVDILDYIVTSNHIHLLLWSKNAYHVSSAMHFLQGNSSKDYNRRKKREGSFWKGRYHPTIIEPGSHLARCFFYIDMNMVRAKAVKHPSNWKCSGYHELCGDRKRYRIINMNKVLECLEIRSKDQFDAWYVNNIENEVSKSYRCRQPIWSEALAIGGKEWIESLSLNINNAQILPAANIH